MLYDTKTAELLEYYLGKYNTKDFIPLDPIAIPHSFTLQQDIEIAALFSALLAWGQRKTIVSNAKKLMQLMDNAPYAFIKGHTDEDLRSLRNFVHRTFNSTDLLFFIAFLQDWYLSYDGLEALFFPAGQNSTAKGALTNFYTTLTSSVYFTVRTKKHIANPLQNSACKRLNMYLRWMVRRDDKGVDFGLWHSVSPSILMCPLDVHVENYARRLGLLIRKQRDWKSVEELTANLSLYCPEDPVKYDYALFGMGIEKIIL